MQIGNLWIVHSSVTSSESFSRHEGNPSSNPTHDNPIFTGCSRPSVWHGINEVPVKDSAQLIEDFRKKEHELAISLNGPKPGWRSEGEEMDLDNWQKWWQGMTLLRSMHTIGHKIWVQFGCILCCCGYFMFYNSFISDSFTHIRDITVNKFWGPIQREEREGGER